jgi:hypothetical protein
MHFPPAAAVLRVSQLRMSPVSSLWKAWTDPVSILECWELYLPTRADLR